VSTSGTVTAQFALSFVFTVTEAGQVNVGTLLSFTVTCTLQVVVFAGVEPSVAVTTIVNVPLSDTLVCAEAAVGDWVIVAVPQLSDSFVMPVSTSGTVTAQLALSFVFTVMAAGQVNVGTLLSFTVTCTLQVVVFTGVDPSVAVTTMVNVPLSEPPVWAEAATGDCVIGDAGEYIGHRDGATCVVVRVHRDRSGAGECRYVAVVHRNSECATCSSIHRSINTCYNYCCNAFIEGYIAATCTVCNASNRSNCRCTTG
jgi:hypothetical protein